MVRQIWWALLVLGPLAYVGEHIGWSSTLTFLLATAGTLPAAALLGHATEELAAGITVWDRARQPDGGSTGTTFGAKVGGLLNATFGNIPELVIGVLALQQGYVSLAKATIIGSVIGNAALVLSAALVVGGIRNGRLRFDAQEAGHHAVLMLLAVASLALPSLFAHSTRSSHVSEISVITAILLLGTYLAYVLYSIFGVQGGDDDREDTIVSEEVEIVRALSEIRQTWSIRRALVVLGLATVLVFLAAEALISTVEPFTAKLGWNAVFVGVIVLPVIGNVAEHSSALLLAYRNKMDVVLGVSSGSSIQVAVFVAPLLVLVSQFGHRLDLTFTSIELASLALVVALFYLVARDGESNWLEGVQLVVLYSLIAAVFFYVPGALR